MSFFISLSFHPAICHATLLNDTDENARIQTKLSAIAIPFIENKGQTHKDVRFYAQTFGGALFVTDRSEMVYSLPVKDGSPATSLVFREKLFGGWAREPVGKQKSASRVNIFKGENPDFWYTAVPTYDHVSLGEVYQGIEVTLKARGRNVEKLFHVRPHADPGIIRVQVEGAQFLHVNRTGELVLTTPSGNVSFTKPVAFQLADDRKEPVDVSYVVSGTMYGFKLGDYDEKKELVIDPLLSTYMGGSKRENANAIATTIIGGKRCIYVAGDTTSNDFPGIAMYQTSQGYNQDAFIALIDMNFTEAQFTYLGGSGEDTIADMAIRYPDGDVFVVGTTTGHFPVTFYGTRHDKQDAFVARLSWDLGTLERSRYFGGRLADFGTAIALHDDPWGDSDDEAVYITGSTRSDDLPKTENAAQTEVNVYGNTAYNDAFAAKFDMDLSLKRSTYLGGASIDSGYDIAVHPTSPHDVYVVGKTSYCVSGDPPWVNKGCFPWTAGGGIPSFVGSEDVFIVRLNANLTANPSPQATYYGGTQIDYGTAIAIHPDTGNVYIVGGRTNEPVPPITFPTDQYAFVAYFDRDLTTYFGDAYIGDTLSKQTDRAQDIKIVSGVGIYVLGWTQSRDLASTAGGILPAFRGGYSDIFVARYHNNLDLDQITYVGGGNQEESFGKGLVVADDPASPQEDWHVFVTGTTYGSGLLGITDATAFQAAFKGESDVLITRLNADLKPDATPDIEVQPRQLNFGNITITSTAIRTALLENVGGAALTISSISIEGAGAGDYTLHPPAGASACSNTFPMDIAGSSSCTVSMSFRPSVVNHWRDAELIIQTANDPDEPVIRLPLRGYCGPDIDAPSPILFPTTQVGATTTKFFIIQNQGVSPLSITSIQKTGIVPSDVPNPGRDFTLRYEANDLYCPDPGLAAFTLGAMEFCYVFVDFSPTSSGSQEAVVFIFSDDLDEDPAFVNLLADGVTDLATDIWSHNLEYSHTSVGNQRALPLLITNTGQEVLSVTGIALSDSINFSYDPNGGAIPCGPPPFSLAKVSSCTMMVTFKPTVAGTFDQTMTLASNDPDEGTFVIHLTGNGISDTDGDGIADAEESGDANGDGTPDAQQVHVAAVRSFDGLHTVVIESQTEETSLAEVRSIPPPGAALPGALGGAVFPFGFYHFKVILPAGVHDAVVTITLPAGETVETYIKYGPEADDPAPHYYDFGNAARYPGAVAIAGNVITLHLTDNGAGDHDGLDNNEILDPGAPMGWMKGDFDRNGVLDLSDAVLCMRILTKSKLTKTVRNQADVDTDGLIGPPDMIYILQKIAGHR
jgi:hypothetical protein